VPNYGERYRNGEKIASGFVTGGNGGIGRGIALGLAQAGAAVAVLARNEEKNQRVMDELQALGVAALAVRVDVAARGELQPALEKVEEALGPISILVNNAGIAQDTGWPMGQSQRILPAPLSFWRPELPILSSALPSSLMAVTPSGES
jgi:NAD(P)-dependent dehydrogenase (short-subunit alcohol dehydrogenase family)